MAFELHFDTEALGRVVASAVQDILYRQRIEPFVLPGDPTARHYVDRVDVAPEGARPPQVPANGIGVEFGIPLLPYVVSEQAVLNAPNRAPEIAFTANMTVFVGMTLVGTRLRMQVTRATSLLAGFDPAPLLSAATGAVLTLDVAAQLSRSLGVSPPSAATMALVARSGAADTLVIGFDTTETLVNRLPSGLDWGVYLSAGSLEQLIEDEVRKSIQSDDTSVTGSDAEWAPNGITPSLEVEVSVDLKIGEPLAPLPLEIDLTTDLSVTSKPSLRTVVQWSFEGFGPLDVVGWLLSPVTLAAMTAIAEKKMVEKLSQPAEGRTVVGDHLFYIDKDLPALNFGPARIAFAQAYAWPDGMTVGGAVITQPLNRSRLNVLVSGWSRYAYVLSGCSSNPPKLFGPAFPSQVTTENTVGFERSGLMPMNEADRRKLFTYFEPEAWRDFFDASLNTGFGGTSLDFRMSGDDVMRLRGEPLRFLVAMPRGVRYIELAPPPEIVLDEAGRVVDSWSAFFDTCIHVDARDPWRATIPVPWAGGGIVVGGYDDAPPVVIPGGGGPRPGNGFLAGLRTFESKLIELTGLLAGETLLLRTDQHEVSVTADARGVAVVPVVWNSGRGGSDVTLTRLNRMPLADEMFGVGSAGFEMTGTALQLQPQASHGACGPATVSSGQLPALPESLRNWAEGVPDRVAIHPMPGHGFEPVAICRLEDGTQLVVQTSPQGVRVAGTIAGEQWGTLEQVNDELAMSAGPAGITTFRRVYSQHRHATHCGCAKKSKN